MSRSPRLRRSRCASRLRQRRSRRLRRAASSGTQVLFTARPIDELLPEAARFFSRDRRYRRRRAPAVDWDAASSEAFHARDPEPGYGRQGPSPLLRWRLSGSSCMASSSPAPRLQGRPLPSPCCRLPSNGWRPCSIPTSALLHHRRRAGRTVFVPRSQDTGDRLQRPRLDRFASAAPSREVTSKWAVAGWIVTDNPRPCLVRDDFFRAAASNLTALIGDVPPLRPHGPVPDAAAGPARTSPSRS